jgi:4-amino-4-deoxy-L-arabinose transferase-like glycosyltransferase
VTLYSINRMLQPAALVALLVCGQFLVWTLAPALTHSAPPLDVVEGYMWGREWVLATYKHPALPSWALEASRFLTGAVGWPAYLLSEACVALTFVCVYLLGRDLMGKTRAAAGTLLLTGIAFYAWPTTEFNHNIAQMPVWAALPLFLWRALQQDKGWRWLLVGTLAALSMYAKLSSALLLAALASWFLYAPEPRARLRTLGPWLALGVCALLLTPLARWLIIHDFAPLRYAALRAGRADDGGLLRFVGSELLNVMGLGAMLWIADLIGPRRGSTAAPVATPAPLAPGAITYLAVLALLPMGIAMLVALASGATLRSAWGIPMFNFAGLFAVALTADRFQPRALKRIAACAAALLVLVPIGYALIVLYLPSWHGTQLRANWPQAEISRRMAAIWRRQTDAPLRIVAGDDWVAGLVGISAPDQPSILSKGSLGLSPWISAERLERQGMLIVWNANRVHIPHALRPLVEAGVRGEEHFSWPGRANGDLAIGYVIVPPKGEEAR